MARFYGTIHGARGPTSRLGNTHSGLEVTAQSYQGDIVVQLFAVGDEDHVQLFARPHGNGGHGAMLYTGPIKYLLDRKGHEFLIEEMAHRAMEKENKRASE